MQTSRYIVKRVLLAFVSIFAIITITYFLMNLMPGDPFMSEKASEENRAILIAKYGLDQPVYVQYGKYLTNLLKGDMGTSYVLQKGRAVKDIIFQSFAVSMGLGVRALILAIVCGIILGCIAGLCKDKWPDAVIRVFSSIGISMPGYVIASALMIFLAVSFKVLPVSYNKPGGWIMPMVTLAIYPTSYLTRLTRASILEVMNQDYLRTERAKGMSEFVVVFVHASEEFPDSCYHIPGTSYCIHSYRWFCCRERIQCSRAWKIFCQLHQPQGLHHDHGCDHLLLSTDRIYEPDL